MWPQLMVELMYRGHLQVGQIAVECTYVPRLSTFKYPEGMILLVVLLLKSMWIPTERRSNLPTGGH